jgi:anhydro-N-acetylmuramic acid kinase
MSKYIGMMSGTSFDGLDAVLIDFADNFKTLGNISLDMPEALRMQLQQISQTNEPHLLTNLYTLDAELGSFYSEAVQQLLHATKTNAKDILAIGCHGQTIRHFPNANPPFTAQLGDPNIIAAKTGITTVADFRRRDLAFGGQGAPFAPLFHHAFMQSPNENRAIVNIGGFANVTLLPKSGSVSGFDTGPGNVLLDAWMQKQKNLSFDDRGKFAETGKVNKNLLARLLQHPYFAQKPPKSTGRDDFNLDWLESVLHMCNEAVSLEDVQATLAELTAFTIASAIEESQPDTDKLYICGGGANNIFLLSRIKTQLPKIEVQTTEALGIHPQHTEAALMAWLAKQTMERKPIDLRAITGSTTPSILGGVYYAG